MGLGVKVSAIARHNLITIDEGANLESQGFPACRQVVTFWPQKINY